MLLAAAACKGHVQARRETPLPPADVAAPVQQAQPVADSLAEYSVVAPSPVPPDVATACDTAAMIVRDTLRLDAKRQDGAFVDSFRQMPRVGCRLTARGSFAALAENADPMAMLREGFTRRRWAPDLRYDADGPDGQDIGLRQLETLCLVGGTWNGGDDDESDTSAIEPGPEDDRYAITIECVRDHASNADAGVPDSIWRIASSSGLDSAYAISMRLRYPPYVEGDFDGDGRRDAAVLVEQRATGKLGVAFVHRGTGRVVVAGAGRALNGAPDDFSWIDDWEVFHRGTTWDMTIRSRPTAVLHGDALWIARGDSAAAFLYWDGRTYRWERASRAGPGASGTVTAAQPRRTPE